MKKGLKIIEISFKENILFTDSQGMDLRTSSFQLLKRNNLGDCLCFVNGKTFVLVDSRDIEKVNSLSIRKNASELFQTLLNKMNGDVTRYPDKHSHFCDGCTHLNISEEAQDYLKLVGYDVDHICKKTGQKVFHRGEEVNIPIPCDCPFKK